MWKDNVWCNITRRNRSGKLICFFLRKSRAVNLVYQPGFWPRFAVLLIKRLPGDPVNLQRLHLQQILSG